MGRWYVSREAGDLALQVVKYQQRDGWSHGDLLRLAHPKTPSRDHEAIFRWILSGANGLGERTVTISGKLTGVRFIRNRLGEVDASGRQSPVAVSGTEFDVELDTLIVAISEQPEADALEGLRKTRWGTLSVHAESCLTDRPGVFGGGDVVAGPSTVWRAPSR